MSLAYPYHLLVFPAVFVLCLILLRILVIESRKFKININFDSHVAAHYGLGDFIGAKTVRFQIVGRCLSHKIHPNWERMIIGAIRANRAPLAFDILGGKVTCIVYVRLNDIPANIRSASVIGSQIDCAIAPDLTLRKSNVQFMGSPQERELESSDSMADINIEKRRSDS